MMKKKVWTKSDRKMMKAMIKEGRTNVEIADALGRTPSAIAFQKHRMSKVHEFLETREDEGLSRAATRDEAKEMARAARQIARANGKRITMAMFFVENI